MLRTILVGAAIALTQPAAAQTSAPVIPKCLDDSSYHLLDFWLGSWNVVDSSKTVVGHNVIERIVGGCAITETWTEPGGEGRSLFYFVPATKRWKQVWVTPQSLYPGGMKEKQFVGITPDGGVRFQGEYLGPRGALILDRTTLTPLGDHRVRQLIELSRDGGHSWKSAFDAMYVADSSPRAVLPRPPQRKLRST